MEQDLLRIQKKLESQAFNFSIILIVKQLNGWVIPIMLVFFLGMTNGQRITFLDSSDLELRIDS